MEEEGARDAKGVSLKSFFLFKSFSLSLLLLLLLLLLSVNSRTSRFSD